MNMNYVFAFLLGVGALFLYLNINNSPINVVPTLDNSVKESTFFMKNNLVCTIEYDSDGKDKGKTISLLDLETDEPRVLFPSGNTSPMKKVSDTEDILVIQLVASGTGSTDTFTVFKSSGKFEEEAKGNVGGDYSVSTNGFCI